MPSVTITAADPESTEWAALLMSGSDPWITLRRGLEDCRKACTDPSCLLFVARSEGRPRGFILLHPKGVAGSPYVRSIAVAADARGTGIGSRLLSYAEELFRDSARHLFLCVSSFNERARTLYERKGYEAVGEFKDYVIAGASEILMMKRLVSK